MKNLSIALVLAASAASCSRRYSNAGPARVQSPSKQQDAASVVRPVDAGRRPRRYDDIPGGATPRRPLRDEITSRILTRHLPEARACYDAEASRTPRLAGSITIRFVIGGKGQVLTSTLQSSTMGNAAAEQCLVELVKRVEFPRLLGGGPVTSSHTFEFSQH